MKFFVYRSLSALQEDPQSPFAGEQNKLQESTVACRHPPCGKPWSSPGGCQAAAEGSGLNHPDFQKKWEEKFKKQVLS